jgi:hypothetical protein
MGICGIQVGDNNGREQSNRAGQYPEIVLFLCYVLGTGFTATPVDKHEKRLHHHTVFYAQFG